MVGALIGCELNCGIIRGGGFTPLSLPGLVSWHDASRAGSLWQDSARTTLATADADPVGAWDDLSPNGYHVLQGTAAARPTRKDAIQNGLTVLRFDGVDDLLQVLSVNLGSQPVTIFAVVNQPAATNNKCVWDGGDGSNRCALFSGVFTPGNSEIFAGSAVGAAHTTGAFHVYEGVYNGASSALLIDGSSIATGDAGAQSLGVGFTVGATHAGTVHTASDFAEFIIVTGGLLSAANLTATRAYLKAKWGTP